MMEAMMTEILFSELTNDGKVRNLVGHERGEDAREKWMLDHLDGDDETVDVVIPGELLTLSSSFFQGMFAQSVKKLGKEGFLAHYRFQASSIVMQQVAEGIRDSLMKRSALG
ncbi:hypothetical protein HKX54_09895 [Sulfitobacter sp. M57]|uniref:hypothetical protein n=1 Tax=unclassified Sulfitobacter TaxID=196795 RepID=UPI0023E0A927|nr:MULTISPECIES: hypothetical protein [unclassified Sulfitobacter]MDF3414764.1 hypothetical protein [Sulfitobacter sp. KE5]MDF3422245.1 hypothetical protein [Sulfitobacter sp. KE43]MDF3433310.1 hypothetical protein [Sulfitobacter sp. KE42]MDF3458950.1 hypothetical protein [Sulfitobacter sp. S74]MDF3462849.1 hypothetical protein [Sulfitobacter sp. Ks18]